jgi:hypothetical protein
MMAMTDIATRLARKLGLLQSPGKDTMKEFVRRLRELQTQQGLTLDQAAVGAAKEIFPEFQPTRYAGGEPIETLIAEIDKL